MIYLIDEKASRQRDYGWTHSRFDEFIKIIEPIHTLDQLTKQKKEELFRDGNVLLIHESFFSNVGGEYSKHSDDLANRLNSFSEAKNDFKVVYFSGSKSTRKLEGKTGYLPVAVLYQNLATYLDKITSGETDLRYLFFGKNLDIEELFLEKLDQANNGFYNFSSELNYDKKVFIARTFKGAIDKFTDVAHYESFFLEEKYDLDVTDDYLDELITSWFSSEVYDKIFIPLCFGPTLSDFNGLRFALHIRCTESPNQLRPIYIYGFVGYDSILNSEFFDILRTKNVKLIGYDKLSFCKSIQDERVSLVKSDLAHEIEKVKLDPPKDYEDDHSIANEWSIYRWAIATGSYDTDIQDIFNTVESKYYFKYLKTIHSERKPYLIDESELKLNFLTSPSVLYIDDEADKGWFEIFWKILHDCNGLEVDYLDSEFNGMSSEQIVQICVQEVKNRHIDVVILDFRLHPDDFDIKNPKEISGYRVLEALKALNWGIQVILFSATNKITNFQALTKAGADGFIVKESPEQGVETHFTENSIQSLLTEFDRAHSKMFLKSFFDDCTDIRNNLLRCDTEDETKFHEFIMDLLIQLDGIRLMVKRFDPDDYSTLDIVFLNCFNFMERFKDYYLSRDGNNQIFLGAQEVPLYRYKPNGNGSNHVRNEGEFISKTSKKKGIYDEPSWFQLMVGLFIDYFKVADADSLVISQLYRVKEARNDFIHGKRKHLNDQELLLIISLCKKLTSKIKE